MSCGHGTTVVPPLALHSVCVCVRAHRHDKWLIFDLGEERPLLGLSILGVVDSFAPARAVLELGPSAEGPWRRVRRFRALGLLKWQHVTIDAPAARFCRMYIRREGHATFRHKVHGVVFHVS